MQIDNRHTWISLFLAIIAGMIYAIWLWVGTYSPIPLSSRDPSPGFGWSWDFDYQQAMREPHLTPDADINRQSGLYPGEMILPLGKPVPVADLNLIYRGPAGSGRFRVDVVIPALDPNYAYSKELSPSEKGNVVSLYGQRFEIMGITNAVLRLKHLSQ
jgi:hypothetical protein